MLENEELGFKIAETREEELWSRVKDNAEKLIKNLEDDLILQKEVLKLCEAKLKKD
jgi:hypothetical protein